LELDFYSPLASLSSLLSDQTQGGMVLLLLVYYKGSVKANGFFWVDPSMTEKNISLQVGNFENKSAEMDDKIGNPVMIGTILVWQVDDTVESIFNVDDLYEYKNFIHLHSGAVIRKSA
jgi:hypothetical protein